MNSENVVPDRSMGFAVRIVRPYQYLCSESKELYKTDCLSKAQYDSICADCEELRSLLSGITRSIRESIRKPEKQEIRRISAAISHF